MTVKGTLLVELQLPAVVTKATLHTPSKAPALTTLARLAASAAPGAATAAKTAAANIHRKACTRLTLATKAINRADIVIFSLLFDGTAGGGQWVCQAIQFHGSSLPIWLGSAISATFIARLIKGCRGDVPAGCFA
jgi:hypothetical protein